MFLFNAQILNFRFLRPSRLTFFVSDFSTKVQFPVLNWMKLTLQKQHLTSNLDIENFCTCHLVWKMVVDHLKWNMYCLYWRHLVDSNRLEKNLTTTNSIQNKFIIHFIISVTQYFTIYLYVRKFNTIRDCKPLQ